MIVPQLLMFLAGLFDAKPRPVFTDASVGKDGPYALLWAHGGD
jgi:hypothetical protein